MTLLPFICLAIGFSLGLLRCKAIFFRWAAPTGSLALVLLMFTIGAKIGMNDQVMSNLGRIGLQCAELSLLTILCSVGFLFLFEKTILPFPALVNQIRSEHLEASVPSPCSDAKKSSSFVWIVPGSIALGLSASFFLFTETATVFLEPVFILSLVLLYTSVGISLAENKSVFRFIKLLGGRVLLPSLAILTGSLLSGLLGALILDVPLSTTLLSTSGMSYYSITGAYMTQYLGIEAGAFGFLVNVLREFFTVLFLPFLIRISNGAPIAAGAAGNMDTMLMPVTRFVGTELGLVALITGTVLTFLVPVLLPALSFFA